MSSRDPDSQPAAVLHQLRPAQEYDISLLKRKVATLEAAVDKLTQAARYQNESRRDGEIGPSEVIANVSDDNPRLLPGTHNEHMYKTRLRGRSHWLTVCNPVYHPSYGLLFYDS